MQQTSETLISTPLKAVRIGAPHGVTIFADRIEGAYPVIKLFMCGALIALVYTDNGAEISISNIEVAA